MPLHQRLVVIGVALAIMIAIFELVRKRRLREEYAWLWLVAGWGGVGSVMVGGGKRAYAARGRTW